jgi:hypothetical protein
VDKFLVKREVEDRIEKMTSTQKNQSNITFWYHVVMQLNVFKTLSVIKTILIVY